MAHQDEPIVEPLRLETESAYRKLGSDLTPDNVSRVLRAADLGDMRPLQDLLTELRQKHPPLHSVLQTRETGVRALSWSCTPPDDSALAAEIAADCEAMLRRMAFRPMTADAHAVGDFGDVIAHLLGAVYRAYAVGELLWDRDEKGLPYPAAFAAIGARRFRYVGACKLVLYDLGAYGADGRDIFAEYPRRFVAHRPRVTGDEPHREGLGRVLLYALCFAIWAKRDWLIFAEMYGRPLKIVTYDKELADAEDIEAAEDIADNGDASEGILKSSALTVDIKWPEASGASGSSPSEAIVLRSDDEIALAVLGQLLTTGEVSGGLGARGDDRANVRRDLIEADALGVGGTIARQVLAPYVLVRWGPHAPVPSFDFELTQVQDAEKFFAAMTTAVTSLGMRIPVTFAHQQVGWPVAGPNEEAVGDGLPEPIFDDSETP